VQSGGISAQQAGQPSPGSDYYTAQTHPLGGTMRGGGRERPTGAPAAYAVVMLGALAALVALRLGFRGFVIQVG
jgi:hypothetical protein